MAAWSFAPVPPPVVRTLVLTDAEGGKHEASITCTPWDARARLRYSDLTTGTAVVDVDPISGRQYVKLGTVQLLATAVTVTAADGFPDVEVTADAEGRGGTEAFDPSRPEHLLALPPEVLRAVQDHALSVQPLPTGRRASATDEDEGEEVVEDPTRTPSTPPVRPAASPAGSRKPSRTSTRKS